ncbi:MAG: LicD family protein [Alistipes sp.]|nr:LicD family protein [Alistipes sp.]
MATEKKDIKREQARALRKQYFNAEAVELLQRFSEALNAEGITFWLEFGTLLGYYREHDFIKHDDDLDFGAYLHDAPQIKRALETRGFKLIRSYTDNGGGLEECYRYLHTTLDVFYFDRNNEGLHCTSYTRARKNLLSSLLNRRPCTVKQVSIPDNGFEPAEYKGCTVNVPADCVEHLTWHYGPTFMTPNPNFNYKEEAKNIRYFTIEERKGVLKIFGKKG